MSGHAIRAGGPICLEPETAECRAIWDRTTCSCEYLSGLEQRADGRWVHVAYSYDLDDDIEHLSVGVEPPNNCNICTWINVDLYSTGPGETWAHGLYAYDVPLPDGLIAVEWEGDYYTWDYTEPRVIGALIGRLVVARWADDNGLEAA